MRTPEQTSEPEIEAERETLTARTLLTVKLRLDDEQMRRLDTPALAALIDDLLAKAGNRIKEQISVYREAR